MNKIASIFIFEFLWLLILLQMEFQKYLGYTISIIDFEIQKNY